MSKVKEKFLRYIKFDTQSDPDSGTQPSTAKQFDLAMKLKSEMELIGLQEIHLSEKCYLTATLPSNAGKEIPTVGFIAHLDTSPDAPGKNVEPNIIENYDGADIILDEDNKIILSPDIFPSLKKYIGQTIITTNGKTLLGADDKAGIAEIIEAAEYLIEHPEIKHGKIKIAFTPDEEIGRGTDFFNVEKFGAEFAYTVDGGEIGELEYENFNAAAMTVNISGRNVHPGTAYKIMINSLEVANEFHKSLPENEKPENTSNYQGFFHLYNLTGNVENAKMKYLIRDFDKDGFQKRKDTALKISEQINKKYKKQVITIDISDTYYNMREKIEPLMNIVDLAKETMNQAGIETKIVPVRGGTDGAKLSFLGLPCPNIFTGGHNFHGIYEYIPVNSMEKAVEVIINISKQIAK